MKLGRFLELILFWPRNLNILSKKIPYSIEGGIKDIKMYSASVQCPDRIEPRLYLHDFKGRNIQAFPGKDKASSEEICEGSGSVNLLRDVDEEAVDDVEVEIEQEVGNGEVDADTVDSKVGEEMELTHKKSEARAKRKKNNSIRTGGKEKWVSCDQPNCIKTFRWPLNLKQHINVVHKKPLKCNAPGCTKKFGTKQDLDRRTANVHLEKRPFKCEVLAVQKILGQRVLSILTWLEFTLPKRH